MKSAATGASSRTRAGAAGAAGAGRRFGAAVALGMACNGWPEWSPPTSRSKSPTEAFMASAWALSSSAAAALSSALAALDWGEKKARGLGREARGGKRGK